MLDWLFKAKERSKEKSTENDAWRIASLRYLSGRLPIVSTIWPNQGEVDSARMTLTKTTEWVKLIEDPRMQAECFEWIEYAQNQIAKAVHELTTNEGARRHEEWRENKNKADVIAREILKRVHGTTLKY